MNANVDQILLTEVKAKSKRRSLLHQQMITLVQQQVVETQVSSNLEKNDRSVPLATGRTHHRSPPPQGQVQSNDRILRQPSTEPTPLLPHHIQKMQCSWKYPMLVQTLITMIQCMEKYSAVHHIFLKRMMLSRPQTTPCTLSKPLQTRIHFICTKP